MPANGGKSVPEVAQRGPDHRQEQLRLRRQLCTPLLLAVRVERLGAGQGHLAVDVGRLVRLRPLLLPLLLHPLGRGQTGERRGEDGLHGDGQGEEQRPDAHLDAGPGRVVRDEPDERKEAVFRQLREPVDVRFLPGRASLHHRFFGLEGESVFGGIVVSVLIRFF